MTDDTKPTDDADVDAETGVDSDATPLPPPAPYERDSLRDMGPLLTEHKAESDEAEALPAPPPAPPGATTAPVVTPDRYDRAGAWLIQHGALPALGVITIVIAIIHARIFHGETAGDDLSFHYAESARLYDCFRHLDFDFWNPSANAGYASLYYYQAIPQLASAIPAAIFGHHLFWFQLSVVLPLVLAPAAAYKGMRMLGATPWQSVVAAFCVAFMNGESRWGAGNAGTFQVGLYTQTWALAAFPLALGYAARWVTKGTHLASSVAWSGFVLLCHPFAGITLGLAVLIAWLTTVVMRTVVAPLLRALAPKGEGRFATWLRHRWAPDVGHETPASVSFFRRPLVQELLRGAALAGLFALTSLPVLLPLVVDQAGFGGFPHRVADEVGPGFAGLAKWYANGALLDWMPKNMGVRIALLTWSLPVIVLLARAPYLRWLWGPAAIYALLLGLGPNVGKIGDDLFPPVRALGAMQTVLAMGIGSGVMLIGAQLWERPQSTMLRRAVVAVTTGVSGSRYAYGVRTGLAALAAGAIVLIAVPGGRALGARVRVFVESDPKRHELVEISKKLAAMPPGRKQAGPGAENHWWNMLPYVWDRIPSTLQMGGGGLQASPNYDFLWTQRDYVKNAWIFDAPYLLFMTSRGKNMPVGEAIIKTENYEVRRLPTPGLVSPVHVTGVLPPGYHHDEPGHKAALEWIKSEAPMKDEVLVYAGFGAAGDAPKGKTLRAWRQDSPGDDADIVADVEAEAPTTYVIRESWHPRWHAYIDGDEVPVRRVTPDFPAVDVPAGKHSLEMRFERPWWAHAAWLAWPLAALAAWFLTRRRKAALPEARVVTSSAEA